MTTPNNPKDVASSAERSRSKNPKRRSIKQGIQSVQKAPAFCKKLSIRFSNLLLTEARVRLKPEIGLTGAIGIMIGNVIGSGIFVSPKGVLEGSGSVGLSLIIWALCGFITLLGALTYAELGTRITETGGSYIYLLEALAPNRKTMKTFWGPIPAFLFNWQSNLFSVPAAMAINALTCAEYLVKLTSIHCVISVKPDEAIKLVACCVLCSVAAINCYSVKWATKLQVIFAAAKVSALVSVIVAASIKLAQGTVGDLPKGFQDTNTSFGDIAMAFYSGLFAFNGWQTLNYVTKEMKNPVRDLPLAIVGATLFAAVFYVLINAAYLIVLTSEELLKSQTVAVAYGYKVTGTAGGVAMVIFVALTTFGSANSGCFTSGRLCYTSAKEGHMVDVLSYIHRDKYTPTPAILFNLLLGCLMVLPTNLQSLISLSGFATWMFIGATQIALLVLKFRKNARYAKLQVPIVVPVIVLTFCTLLVLTPLIIRPRIEYFFVVGFLFIGFLAYVVFVYFEVSCFGMRYITKWIQATLYVIPPEK